MPATAPLRVDLIGADQRLRDTLALVFRGPARGVCQLVPRDDAQAVVVNLDQAGAATEWARYRETHPERPAIVLSITATPVPHAAAVVAKPVRIEQLVEAVRVARSLIAEAPRRPAAVAAPLPPRLAARAEASLPPALDRPPVRAPLPPLAPVEIAPTSVRAATSEDEPTVATPFPHEAPRTLPSSPTPATTIPEAPRTQAFAALPAAASPARSIATRSQVRDTDRGNPQWVALCGDAPDVSTDDPAQVERIRYTGDARFLGAVEQAVETSRFARAPVVLRTQGRLLFVVSAARSLAMCDVSDDLLATLCRQRSDVRDFDSVAVAALPAPSEVMRPITVEALLWKLALWTYRGRLPYATSLDDRMYLRHWPNFTRLARTPDALRIAALLTRHPMQLVRVAEALRIPQRHVFAFHAAASTVGLMGVARREIDHLLEQEAPVPHEHRELLERVAQRLASGDGGGDAS